MNTLSIIEIKNPCQQNWEAMKPNDKGRFCNSCQTTVIDFTNKTPIEISVILKSNSPSHSCGSFNSWNVKSENKLDNFIWKLNTRGFRHAALFILGILILVGCRTHKKGKTNTTTGRFLNKAESKIETVK